MGHGRARGQRRGSSTPATNAVPGASGSSTGNGRGRGRGRPVSDFPETELGPALSQLNVRGVRERGVRATTREDQPGRTHSIQSGLPPGQPVSLHTNYLKLVKSNGLPVYQYSVEINPEVDNVKKKMGMMYNGIEELKDKIIYKNHILYTYMDTIGDKKEYHVVSRDRRGTETTHTVTLKRTLEVQKDSVLFANVFFNFIAERMPNWKRIRRDYFDHTGIKELPRFHVEVMPGYQFRVGDFQAGPLMSIDTKHRVLRTMTVLTFIQELITKRGHLRTAQTDIIRELTGRVVMTRYNNNSYKIDDVLFDMKACDEIELQPGYKISSVDYYKNRYNIELRDPEQIMLLSIKKQLDNNGMKREIRIHLVPEVCYLTGFSNQEFSNKASPMFKEISKVTHSHPADKVRILTDFANTVNHSQLSERWGLQVETSLLQLEGGNINNEVPIVGLNDKFYLERGKFDNITRKRFVLSSAGIGENCHIICQEKDMQEALKMVESGCRFARAAGIDITFTREHIVQVKSQRAEEFIKAGSRLQSKAILFILPNEKEDRITKLVYGSEIHIIIFQVVLAKTLRNSNGIASKITKILMQIDVKAGGKLWKVDLPTKNTMFLGIDTNHDSMCKRSSVGGFVASMDQDMTRYYSRIFQHDNSSEEVFSGLQPLMKDTLNEYHKLNNNCYPKRIIVFRDGVGYGQMELVRELEIEAIKRAMSELQLQETELVFTVVSKRINTRLFMKRGTNYQNPFQGTVVSNKITKCDQAFDFFIVSQSVNQGTVSPTHYTVLEWRTSLRPEDLQRICFRLCHMYFNWTGIISVPAPCQYAHKLAFLVGQSLHNMEPAPLLRHNLFYL
ncbi:hypothetical protein ACHWQZ_G010579 [Mnemiopsis leidyi]